MRHDTRGTVWHYTTGNKLEQIYRSGFLMPTGVGAAPNESPILWFSRNQEFEITALKEIVSNGDRIRPTMQQLHEVVGLYRFGVAEKNYPFEKWPSVSRKAGTRRKEIDAMGRIGQKWGAHPSDWLGMFQPVDIDDVHFQAWDGKKWNDANLQQCMDHFRTHGPKVLSVKGTLLK